MSLKAIHEKLIRALSCRPIGVYDWALKSWVVEPTTDRYEAVDYVRRLQLSHLLGIWYAAKGKNGEPLPLTADELELVHADEERAVRREAELREWEKEEEEGMAGPPRPVGVYDDLCQVWRVEPSMDYAVAVRYILERGYDERDGVWYAVSGRNKRPMDLSPEELRLVKAAEDAIKQ
jgi:hypothetical protein